jgi:anti-sigma regulatory factor (Ser/Thr protein kinase)
MSDARVTDLILCASEAATNALVHGDGGLARVQCLGAQVRVRVEDCGAGIHPDHLPRATLMKGWSTRASMGLGFTVMKEAADRIHLHTGPSGTTVIVEMGVTPCPPASADPFTWGPEN